MRSKKKMNVARTSARKAPLTRKAYNPFFGVVIKGDTAGLRTAREIEQFAFNIAIGLRKEVNAPAEIMIAPPPLDISSVWKGVNRTELNRLFIVSMAHIEIGVAVQNACLGKEAPFGSVTFSRAAQEKCGYAIVGDSDVRWTGRLVERCLLEELEHSGIEGGRRIEKRIENRFKSFGENKRKYLQPLGISFPQEMKRAFNVYKKLGIEGQVMTGLGCFGENWYERQRGNPERIIESQVNGLMHLLSDEQVADAIFPYQSVWAKGNTRVVTPDMAQERCAQAAELSMQKTETDENLSRIVYDGRVSPENVGDFMSQPDIHGIVLNTISQPKAANAGFFVRVVKAGVRAWKY
jgi:triosephosphate isomerase